jgi:hypothetical protein
VRESRKVYLLPKEEAGGACSEQGEVRAVPVAQEHQEIKSEQGEEICIVLRVAFDN